MDKYHVHRNGYHKYCWELEVTFCWIMEMRLKIQDRNADGLWPKPLPYLSQRSAQTLEEGK